MAREQDIAVTAWGLIAAGAERKYGQTETSSATRVLQRNGWKPPIKWHHCQPGRSHPAQVAIRWVYQQQARAQIIPILGARSLAQMEENLEILDFELAQEQLTDLDAVAKFDPVSRGPSCTARTC